MLSCGEDRRSTPVKCFTQSVVIEPQPERRGESCCWHFPTFSHIATNYAAFACAGFRAWKLDAGASLCDYYEENSGFGYKMTACTHVVLSTYETNANRCLNALKDGKPEGHQPRGCKQLCTPCSCALKIRRHHQTFEKRREFQKHICCFRTKGCEEGWY